EIIGAKPADERTGDRGEAPDAGDVTLIAPALARRDDIGDRRLAEAEEAAAADALQRARSDQHAHVLRQAAGRRGDDEHRDGELQQPPAAIEIAELTVDRRRDRAGQKIRGDDPG